MAELNPEQLRALSALKMGRQFLTRQQTRSLRGQILAGQTEQALRGLLGIIRREAYGETRRKEKPHEDPTRQSPGHSVGQQPKNKNLEE